MGVGVVAEGKQTGTSTSTFKLIGVGKCQNEFV